MSLGEILETCFAGFLIWVSRWSARIRDDGASLLTHFDSRRYRCLVAEELELGELLLMDCLIFINRLHLLELLLDWYAFASSCVEKLFVLNVDGIGLDRRSLPKIYLNYISLSLYDSWPHLLIVKPVPLLDGSGWQFLVGYYHLLPVLLFQLQEHLVFWFLSSLREHVVFESLHPLLALVILSDFFVVHLVIPLD